IHLRLPQDRLARLRHYRDPLRTRPSVPGIEVAKGISAGVSQPRHLPGKHRESCAGRHSPMGQAGVGRGKGRVPSARGDFDRGDRAMAAKERSEVRGQIAEAEATWFLCFYFCNLTSDFCNLPML